MRVLIHDLETQTHPWYGHPSSPHCPNNYVVMDAFETVTIGGKELITSNRTERRYKDAESFRKEWSVPLDGIDVYVAHNAAFEMSWMLKHDRDNFLAFIKRGGRVFCTQLAHYLLSNQTHTYPALNEVAPLYGGTHKVDGVKLLWDQGILTSDIDPELLSEYLTGPSGDIENTTKVFLGTWNKLRARGMMRMALIRMDSLLYSAVCMDHGLMIDMDRAGVLQQQNVDALAELHDTLYATLPKDMPEEARAQFRGTRFQLSALVFGGPMKYESQVPRTTADGKVIYKKAEGPYFDSIKGALPPEECVIDAEAGGLYYHPIMKEHQARYKLGKNKGAPKTAKYETNEVDTKKGDLFYEFPGMLGPEVRNKLDEVIQTKWAGAQKLSDGSPVYSTSGDTLSVLTAHGVEIAQTLGNIAAIDKDLGSFYLKEDNKGKVSGMLQYVQPTGLIHHNLNHTSTVTGRLSSNKPNLQQLPRAEEAKEGEFKSRVKEVFVSRFDDGVILQEDYSALETVGLQTMSKDVALKDALLEGKDMHCMRLSAMEGHPYEYVLARAKDEEHPDFPVWNRMRTEVKPVAFQYQYGATAYGMAMSTGKSQEFCQAFIDAERKAFPGVEDWYDNTVYPQVESTSVSNKPIRLAMDDDRYILVRWGTYTAPSGTTYQFQQVPKMRWNPATKKREEQREFVVPQMRNYPVQGESGFFVQLACGMLIRHFIQKDFYGNKALPINTVHDACYFDVSKDVVKQVAIEVEAIMECIPEMLNLLWPSYACEVPFPVAGGAGPNMAVEHHLYTKEGKADWLATKRAFKAEFLESKGTTIQF